MTATASTLTFKPIAAPERARLTLIPGGKTEPESGQSLLELEFETPVDELAMALVAPAVRLVHSDTWVDSVEDEDDGFFDRQPTGTAELPDAQLWAHRFAQLLSEVARGARPTRQVRRWVTPAVLRALRPHSASTKASRARNGRSSPVVVKRVRVDQPADGIAEVAAVVRSRERSHALALRLEGWDGRWICTRAHWI